MGNEIKAEEHRLLQNKEKPKVAKLAAGAEGTFISAPIVNHAFKHTETGGRPGGIWKAIPQLCSSVAERSEAVRASSDLRDFCS